MYYLVFIIDENDNRRLIGNISSAIRPEATERRIHQAVPKNLGTCLYEEGMYGRIQRQPPCSTWFPKFSILPEHRWRKNCSQNNRLSTEWVHSLSACLLLWEQWAAIGYWPAQNEKFWGTIQSILKDLRHRNAPADNGFSCITVTPPRILPAAFQVAVGNIQDCANHCTSKCVTEFMILLKYRAVCVIRSQRPPVIGDRSKFQKCLE